MVKIVVRNYESYEQELVHIYNMLTIPLIPVKRTQKRHTDDTEVAHSSYTTPQIILPTAVSPVTVIIRSQITITSRTVRPENRLYQTET